MQANSPPSNQPGCPRSLPSPSPPSAGFWNAVDRSISSVPHFPPRFQTQTPTSEASSSLVTDESNIQTGNSSHFPIIVCRGRMGRPAKINVHLASERGTRHVVGCLPQFCVTSRARRLREFTPNERRAIGPLLSLPLPPTTSPLLASLSISLSLSFSPSLSTACLCLGLAARSLVCQPSAEPMVQSK